MKDSVKDNSHKKRTFIDRFARNYYCKHARLNILRADKHKARRDERHYQKSLLMNDSFDDVYIRAFCINCRDYTTCKTAERTNMPLYYHAGRADEEVLSYNELYAFCSVCGEEVYVPEINDENCDRREQELRRWKGSM